MSQTTDYISRELKGATGITWQYNESKCVFYSSPVDQLHLGHSVLRLKEIAPSLQNEIKATQQDANGYRMICLSESQAKTIVNSAEYRRKDYRSTANVPAPGR